MAIDNLGSFILINLFLSTYPTASNVLPTASGSLMALTTPSATSEA